MKNSVTLALLVMVFCLGCGQSDTGNGDAENKEGTAPGASENAKVERYKPKMDSKVVALVNGVPIYEEELRGAPIETAVTEEILYQEGLRRGLDKKHEKQVVDYQVSLVVRDVKMDIVQQLPAQREVTDKDIEKYYDRVKSKYSDYHIVEINFTDQNLGPEILKTAGEGKELKDIADSFPEQEQNVTFVDLGDKRELVKYFKAREVGSLSEVVQKPDGTFSIYKIVGERQTPLSNVKFSIKHNLEARRGAVAIDSKAREIAEQNNMKIEIIEQPNN